MIPAPSSISFRRADRRSRAGASAVMARSACGGPVAPCCQVRGVGLAQERLPAGAVADDDEGVLLARVAGDVEQPGAGLRRALPDPPAIVVVDRRRVGGQLVAEALSFRDELRDAGGPLGLGLAGVRVVLADVRGHSALLGWNKVKPVAASCERSPPPGGRG